MNSIGEGQVSQDGRQGKHLEPEKTRKRYRISRKLQCLTEKWDYHTISMDGENSDLGKDYSELGISNDFMFGKIMGEPERCRAFLEQILNIEIEHVEILERQKSIDEKIDARSVRLDIYVDDGKTIYNCEMQTAVRRSLPKRCRYYQSQIDMKCLSKGQDYTELKKSYVIFICTFDPFDLSRYIYTFENVCLEAASLHLHDDAIKVFINTKGLVGDVSDDFRELMHFLDTSEMKPYNNPLVNDMARALEEARTRSEWRQDYMSIEMLKRDSKEEGRLEGREEGREEGRKEGREEGEDRLAVLMQKLFDAKRFDDAQHASMDKAYRDRLFVEFGIAQG